MKIVNKVEPSERIITAEFTQSEWNELAACFGYSSTSSRTENLEKIGIKTKVSEYCELFDFLMDQVR